MVVLASQTKPQAGEFLSGLIRRNPNHPIFYRAAQDFAEAVFPFVESHPHYQKRALLERLTEPDRVVHFPVVWTDDRCKVHVNRGFVVEFNQVLGPYHFELLFNPVVGPDLLKFYAFDRVLRYGLAGMPKGGGATGSDFDPKGRSGMELSRFSKAFRLESSRHLPPGSRLTSGKEHNHGGSTVLFMDQMLRWRGETMEGKRCLVSGSSGKALQALEKILDLGGIPLTLSDPLGTVFDPGGICRVKLTWWKEKPKRPVSELAREFGLQYIPGARPWNIPADLAFPCITQGEIAESDAVEMVRNGLVAMAEGVSLGVSREGAEVLRHARVLHAPAMAAGMSSDVISGVHARCVEFGQEEEGYIDYLKGAHAAAFASLSDALIRKGKA